MKISNKLTKDDFVELQQILFENYKPNKVLSFMIRYVTALLYGFAVFTVSFLYLAKNMGDKKWPISIAAAIIVFIIFALLQPTIYRRKARRAIERSLRGEKLEFEREVEFKDDSFTTRDERGEKTVNFSEIADVYKKDKSYFVTTEKSGYVFKATDETTKKVDELFRSKNLVIKER